MAVYALTLIFIGATWALGQFGFSPARLLFVMGCAAVGYQALRSGGLPLHAQITMVLFVVAPFLRRTIDMHVGYDESGTMLVGPLVSVAVALTGLPTLLTVSTNRHLNTLLPPFILMTGCVLYGWALSSFQGTWFASSVAAAKYLIPLLYALRLMLEPSQGEAVLLAVARCCLLIGPLMGLYGIYQYLDPPAWDRMWMIASKNLSIGLPLPLQVRVFGTMNGPASFAAFAVAALVLLSFSPRSISPPNILLPAIILPLALALLLSSVRSAWISAAIALLYCLLFNRTRSRATLLLTCLVLTIVAALAFSSFSEGLTTRFSSLNNGTNDGSGQDRMADYMHVFGGDDRYIFGMGLAPVDSDPQMIALDGQVLTSAVQMGTTIGVLFVLGMLWASFQAIRGVTRSGSPLRVAAAAIIAGMAFTLPLTTIAIGELGFLFWMLVGVVSTPVPTPKRIAHRSGRALARSQS